MTASTLEFERRFLCRNQRPPVPEYTTSRIEDYYISVNGGHPQLRLRRQDVLHQLTKKTPIAGGDLSRMSEETIPLSREEFEWLAQRVSVNPIKKRRYTWVRDGFILELGVYEDALAPLCILDVEIIDPSCQPDLASALAPFDVVREVTNDSEFAAGNLLGKCYSDLPLAA